MLECTFYIWRIHILTKASQIYCIAIMMWDKPKVTLNSVRTRKYTWHLPTWEEPLGYSSTNCYESYHKIKPYKEWDSTISMTTNTDCFYAHPLISPDITLMCRVLNFNVYHPVRVVHTGPREYRNANHPLLDSPVFWPILRHTNWYRDVSTGTAPDFDDYRGISIGTPWHGK